MVERDRRVRLLAVAVKGLLYWPGKVVLSAFHCPPHAQFGTGKLASRLESGCTELGVKLRLRSASLRRGRRFIATLPLVHGPAHSDARKANGDQHDGGDEPLSHDVLHYSRKISNRSVEGRELR